MVDAYANGLFSSRRIERATHRGLGVRLVTANTHPDHDTIAAFRRQNRAAFEAAFLDILLMARQTGLLRVGTVSIDGTKIDVVCADGSQLVLATNLVATSADAPSVAETILGMQGTVGLPDRVLADTGYASAPAVEALQAQGVEPLVAIGRTQPHRPYDFRPPPPPKTPRRTTELWRIEMKAKLETVSANPSYSAHAGDSLADVA